MDFTNHRYKAVFIAAVLTTVAGCETGNNLGANSVNFGDDAAAIVIPLPSDPAIPQAPSFATNETAIPAPNSASELATSQGVVGQNVSSQFTPVEPTIACALLPSVAPNISGGSLPQSLPESGPVSRFAAPVEKFVSCSPVLSKSSGDIGHTFCQRDDFAVIYEAEIECWPI